MLFSNPRPRTYTADFGQRMAELLPSFNESPALRPSSIVDSLMVAKLRAMSMGTDEWADAGVPDLLRYVYGAKGLNIPEEWRPCFPASHFA